MKLDRAPNEGGNLTCNFTYCLREMIVLCGSRQAFLWGDSFYFSPGNDPQDRVTCKNNFQYSEKDLRMKRGMPSFSKQIAHIQFALTLFSLDPHNWHIIT